ncbi:MAG: chemotaxis protein CheX [Myxococcota bacterium]
MTDEMLQELIGVVWETVIDGPPGGEPAGAGWLGSVAIDGAWDGRVEVWLSDADARRVATAMFGEEPIGEPELVDAIGELANITGGNVKALLPEPCGLGLPAVRAAARPAPWGGVDRPYAARVVAAPPNHKFS